MPVAVVGLAGCGKGTVGQTAALSGSTAKASSDGAFTAAMLRGALLTRVNGVAAAAPASSGKYASLPTSSSAGKRAASAAQVIPKACAGEATAGFDPNALAGAPAAAVTFRVGTNGVSEVLIASSAGSATTALAGHVPTKCAQYEEKIEGKTFKYGVKEHSITGIGKQARVVNVHTIGANPDDMWSLIYRGSGFVGTVTVVGPNASEQAVKELGQQAYAFAVKSLA
ncbi:MAG: hypothetical protein ACRDOI_00225 [Trebonia sp.]